MKLKRVKDPPVYKQPVKCKGCDWGRWNGMKQVCMMPRCVKWWRRV